MSSNEESLRLGVIFEDEVNLIHECSANDGCSRSSVHFAASPPDEQTANTAGERIWYTILPVLITKAHAVTKECIRELLQEFDLEDEDPRQYYLLFRHETSGSSRSEWRLSQHACKPDLYSKSITTLMFCLQDKTLPQSLVEVRLVKRSNTKSARHPHIAPYGMFSFFNVQKETYSDRLPQRR